MEHLRTRELEPTSKAQDRRSLPDRIAAATKNENLVAADNFLRSRLLDCTQFDTLLPGPWADSGALQTVRGSLAVGISGSVALRKLSIHMTRGQCAQEQPHGPLHTFH